MTTWTFAPVQTSSSSKGAFQNPPGYSNSSSNKKNGASKAAASSSTVSTAPNKKSLEALRQQRGWDLAIGPAKAVPMQGFMLYMSGGGVQIFSLMIVFQLIKGAIAGMFDVNRTFEPLEQQSASAPSASPTASRKQANTFTTQKIVHILSQGALLALGLYKCHSMGLLPTHDSDWLAFSKQRIPSEVSEISLGGWWQK